MKKTTTIKSLTLSLFALFVTHVAEAQLAKFQPYTYVSLSKAGMNNAAKSYRLGTTTNPETMPFTVSSPFPLPYNINGIGLNSVDSLLYGASWTGDNNGPTNALNINLYRLGANGDYQDLGELPNSGQNSLEFVNYAAGTVKNGTYYYTTFGFNASGFSKILNANIFGTTLNLNADDVEGYLVWINNISNLTGTSPIVASGFAHLNLNHTRIKSALNAYLSEISSHFPNVYDADGGLQDMDIHPTSGQMFSYITYPTGSGNMSGFPIEFSTPSSNMATVNPVGTVTNTIPGKELAGLMFSNTTSELFGLFITGDYAKIDLSTGALITPFLASGLPTLPDNTGSPSLRGDLARAFLPPIPTPVSLLAFNVKKNELSVDVTWKVVKEIDFKGYQIERSNNGHNWSTIANIESKYNGVNSGENSYEFNDKNPLLGRNFYRLAQIDNDGTTVYSENAYVIMDHVKVLSVYPNPAKNLIHIQAYYSESDQITIFDINGQIKFRKTGSQQVDISSWATGTYILELKTVDGQSFTKTILKL